MARDQHSIAAEFVRQRRGVQWTCAAERDQRELARVIAFFNRHDLQSSGHIGVDDADDTFRRLMQRHAEWTCNVLQDRRLGAPRIDRHMAPEQVRRHASENEIGIGHRRQGSAAAVAGRARIGARALGADDEATGGSYARDRAAAGADGMDIYDRQTKREWTNFPLGRHLCASATDHTYICTGASDIDADRIFESRKRGDVAGTDHPRCRPRQRHVDRSPRCFDWPEHAAIGTHDQQRRGDVALSQAFLELSDIARDKTLNVGIESRGHGTLVFAEHRQHR